VDELNGEEPLEGDEDVKEQEELLMGENVFSGVGIVHAVFCPLSPEFDDKDKDVDEGVDDLLTGEGDLWFWRMRKAAEGTNTAFVEKTVLVLVGGDSEDDFGGSGPETGEEE